MGWQSGSSSGVFFTPRSPAALLISKTSPLGTLCSRIASIVLELLTSTRASAVAIRSVLLFAVISTITYSLSTDDFHSQNTLFQKQEAAPSRHQLVLGGP